MKTFLLFTLGLYFSLQVSGQAPQKRFSYEESTKVEKQIEEVRKKQGKKKTKTKLFEGFEFGMNDADLDKYILNNDLSERHAVVEIDGRNISFVKSYFLNKEKLNGLKLLVTKREIEKHGVEVNDLAEGLYTYFSTRYKKGQWFKANVSTYSYIERNLNITIDPFDLGHMRAIVVLFYDSLNDE